MEETWPKLITFTNFDHFYEMNLLNQAIVPFSRDPWGSQTRAWFTQLRSSDRGGTSRGEEDVGGAKGGGLHRKGFLPALYNHRSSGIGSYCIN